MTPARTPQALLASLVCIVMVADLAACGTIMYPERNGQRAGQIDPLVAVLDGVGLLFFLIPGVIAFAVDFNNHSIYLPHGKHAVSIRVDGPMDRATIEAVVRRETGVAVSLRQPQLQVSRVDSRASLEALLAGYEGSIRVASLR